MSDFQLFAMERMMSKFEQEVEYNLSESGVHPMTLDELISYDPECLDRLLATELNYPHANGIPELRDHIAAMYEGATAKNVLVTVGAAEANFNTVWTLIPKGNGIAVMLPNYMQIWGVAKNFGFDMKTFHLHEERNWGLDPDELNDAVTEDTRLIAVCNPNNPTGHILTESEMDAVISAAGRVGAWILADEVYRGSERVMDEESPSFYGRYERVIAVGGMSKAYGLPGLRIGWVVGPEATVDDIWARHEYTAISATMLSNRLAAFALSPEVRPHIIERARGYIRTGFPVLQRWGESHGETISMIPPQAAAIAFVKYHLDVNSSEFTDRLRREKSVLIVPGDHFGMDGFVRISFGLPHEYLSGALGRINELIAELTGS
jgi:aspartate/methionine/tyrosine aminotransferase